MGSESPLQIHSVPASSGLEVDQQKSIPSALHFKWIVGFILLYFAGRLVFYALTISGFVPPDEVTHLGLSRIFSEVLLFPENSSDTYRYGLVTNVPWLYYWVMGKFLFLNVVGASDLVFLRLLNIPFAFGTVYFVWRLLRLLTTDRLSQILLIVAMTNTSMFSFLSASISYDNLINLLAAMSVYYLLAFFQNRSADMLVGSLLCQLAGCITKTSFLPLSFILILLLLIHEFKNFRGFGPAIMAYLHQGNWRSYGLLAAILICFLLNLQLYGGNLLRYKKLAPDMSVVLSLEIALKNRIAARDMIFTLFKEQRISYEQALGMSTVIDHPGDRADAIDLVQNYVKHVNSGATMLSPLSYIVPWTTKMLSGIFGISGHRSMYSYWLTNLSIVILMALTALAMLVRWRPRKDHVLPSLLALVVVFYGLFLMYVVNYRIYVDTAYFPMALQGRYLFPVLGPIYLLCCYYLLRLFNNGYARLLLSAAAAFVFIASDFPFFLTHVTPEWFFHG